MQKSAVLDLNYFTYFQALEGKWKGLIRITNLCVFYPIAGTRPAVAFLNLTEIKN